MIRRVTFFTVCIIGYFVFSAAASSEVLLSKHAAELKNRFRIDHMVESVTLLIHREYGSAPVIIVRPDGSKWYVDRHPDDKVTWMEGLTGDMITIKQPMAGPWQLIGQVVEGSVIDKVTDLTIQVEPIPKSLFQGERLKLTAQLLGDAERVRLPGLDFMMNWTARFISENNPADENYAAGTFIVGAYRDNGESLDERPDDGIFTSDLDLDQPWGDYRLQIRAKNAVLDREYNDSFRLLPQPIKLELLAPEQENSGIWTIEVQVDDSQVKLNNTHLEAEILGPTGKLVPVTLTNLTESSSQFVLPKVMDFGSYHIKTNAVTTTLDGREIYLQLPELFFNLVEPPSPPPTQEELAARAEAIAKQQEQQAKDKAIFWIASVNGALILVGIIVLLIVRKRSNLKKALAATEARLEKEVQKEKMLLELDQIDLTIPDEEQATSARKTEI
ncbi:TIGR03503 family protein [Shewanella fidelis]|uniref:TIGR03503 family protein n=1 Tax=Shewanella fidelis TaxID=173509 RepID=A0AAW8NQ77_9GAMM|nr:TIGR03503 family protein [Shewanella fidelis]MDR8524064.1 TIGR03503 family protein [Shewanella fidelis]MDW4810611.1 TIGR03503 family protein [Shewanella fidelis]MDW4814732.1 TIGR03503 family protein [Shewanella fidelis]MDW4818822.1 TIGR03503 family protein [Shewanella fidelis]MDW4823501.1 TIGR03503 family protein [Shewanella fidelis]